MKKTSWQEIVEKATQHGVVPTFEVADYKDNRTPLPWQCAKRPEHRFQARFGDIRRGCPLCRPKNATKRLGFGEIREKAAAQGMQPDFEEAAYLGNKVPMRWRCLTNPEHVVVARFNNLRNGCSECRKEAGSPKRLTFEQVTERAKALGFRPGFEPKAYGGNQTLLPWICLKNAEHVQIDTLGHLERGCQTCRAEAG